MVRSGSLVAMQLLPCVLLVTLGWGWDKLPGFLQNPARAGLAAVTIAGAVMAILFRLELRPLRKGLGPVGRQSLELGILLLLSLFLLWFLPFADRRRILTFRANSWRYVGLSLCCVGVVVRLLALRALGGCFSGYITLQPNHRLVQNGIYHVIRHPLYLSLLLAPAGIALVFASLLAVPIVILAALFVADRIKREDRLLAAHFGAEFEDYRRRVWTLVPFLI